MIDVKGEREKVQSTLDGITKDGFWCGVFFPDGGSLMLLPYRLEVLGAHPTVGADGSVQSWRWSVLVIDRGFAEIGAPMHAHHLHLVDRIEWQRNAAEQIWSGRLYDADGNRLVVNPIDPGDDPDLAAEWTAYAKKLARMPGRVAECLESIRREYRGIMEANLR